MILESFVAIGSILRVYFRTNNIFGLCFTYHLGLVPGSRENHLLPRRGLA